MVNILLWSKACCNAVIYVQDMFAEIHWNATSFQILSTYLGQLTHLSDVRGICRAPMVHLGFLIDWITVCQKTQFEEEVNKATCPQQPVRLFERFAPLAGDSSYLDLSETLEIIWNHHVHWYKRPSWRTQTLETWRHISIFTKSLQFWWSSKKSHPSVLNSVDVWPTQRLNWWILVDLGFLAGTRLLLLMWPFNLQVSWTRAENTLNSCKFRKHYMSGRMNPRDPWQVEKHVTELLGRSLLICSNAYSLSTPHSHWPRFLRPECLHLPVSAVSGPEIIALRKQQPKWLKN